MSRNQTNHRRLLCWVFAAAMCGCAGCGGGLLGMAARAVAGQVAKKVVKDEYHKIKERKKAEKQARANAVADTRPCRTNE